MKIALRYFILLSLFSLGCARCSQSAQTKTQNLETVLQHVPEDCDFVAVVSSFSRLSEAAKSLEKLSVFSVLAAAQGFESAPLFFDELVRQWGVDIRDLEDVKKMGIDVGAPLVMGRTQALPFLILQVQNSDALNERLKKILSQRLQVTSQTASSINGVAVTQLVNKNSKAVLTIAKTDFGVVLVRGDDTSIISKVKDAHTSIWPQKIRAEDDDAVSVFTKGGRISRMQVPSSSVHLVIRDPDVALSVVTGRESIDSTRLAGSREPQLKHPLPNDAFIVTHAGAGGEELKSLLHFVLNARQLEVLKRAKLDIEGKVLPNVAAGSDAAFFIAKDVNLSRGMPALDLRKTNPFQFVQLAGFLAAKQDAPIDEILSDIQKAAPQFGAKITAEKKGAVTAYYTNYAQGDGVHFAKTNGGVLFGSPKGRFDAFLEGKNVGQPLAPEFQKYVDGATFSAVLDVHKLLEQIKGLPDSAWGVGGFAMKDSAQHWLESLKDIRAVVVRVVDKPENRTLQLQLLRQVEAEKK